MPAVYSRSYRNSKQLKFVLGYVCISRYIHIRRFINLCRSSNPVFDVPRTISPSVFKTNQFHCDVIQIKWSVWRKEIIHSQVEAVSQRILFTRDHVGIIRNEINTNLHEFARIQICRFLNFIHSSAQFYRSIFKKQVLFIHFVIDKFIYREKIA